MPFAGYASFSCIKKETWLDFPPKQAISTEHQTDKEKQATGLIKAMITTFFQIGNILRIPKTDREKNFNKMEKERPASKLSSLLIYREKET